jgi:hypothetical protein
VRCVRDRRIFRSSVPVVQNSLRLRTGAVTISLRRLVPFCLFFGEPDGFSRRLSHVEGQHDLFLTVRMLLSPQYEEQWGHLRKNDFRPFHLGMTASRSPLRLPAGGRGQQSEVMRCEKPQGAESVVPNGALNT